MTANQLKLIFVLYKQVGITESDRHDFQGSVTGKESLKDMDKDDAVLLITAIRHVAHKKGVRLRIIDKRYADY